MAPAERRTDDGCAIFFAAVTEARDDLRACLFADLGCGAAVVGVTVGEHDEAERAARTRPGDLAHDRPRACAEGGIDQRQPPIVCLDEEDI